MDCIFCQIIKGELPSQKVYENERILAFRDINPVAPVHILIIPKKHIDSFADLKEEDIELYGELILATKEVARKEGILNSGFRLISNSGSDGGQLVSHLHLQLIGGKPLGPKIIR